MNNAFRERLEKAGLVFSGLSSDRKLVEMIEIPGHPWFVAGQFHPEFTSTPRDGHPLFEALSPPPVLTKSVIWVKLEEPDCYGSSGFFIPGAPGSVK